MSEIVTSLPDKPNLENLRKRAKTLLNDFKKGDTRAIITVKKCIAGKTITLRQAQYVIARQYGFNTWAELAVFVSYHQEGKVMINRINWFWIPVKNLSRAAEFYKKVMACDVWVHKEDGFAVFEWENGKASGGLQLAGSDIDVGTPGADGVRILLNCEGRLDDAIAEVKKNNGEVLSICTLGEYGIQAIIKDTEGNRIHLHTFTKDGATLAEKEYQQT